MDSLIVEIEKFLEHPHSIDKMIEATKKGKPALELVIPKLLVEVEGDYNGTVRKRTGKLAKKIMEEQGYIVNRKDQRKKLPANCFPFNSASTYLKT